METLMSDQTVSADHVLTKRSVAKYADSIIRWGSFFRNLLTVLGWIYLIGGPLGGFAIGQSTYEPGMYFLYGLIIGVVGSIAMFGYRLIFDYMLMKAHQSKL
jgi:hypothetical protein